MLIQSRPEKFDDRIIRLPDWVRAPLGLTENSTCYYYGLPAPEIGYELFLTTYPIETWEDLWRIEIDFDDETGLISKILQIFDENKIYILDAETTITRQGNGFSTYFVCSLHDYENEIDKDSNFRAGKSNPTLFALDIIISEVLVDSLWFDKNSSPRIRIKRINIFHKISQKLKDNQDVKEDEICLSVCNKSIELPLAFYERIKNKVTRSEPYDRMLYVLSSDTKDRLSRVIFLNRSDNLFQFRIYFQKKSWCLHNIFSTLRERQYNIIESKIRYNAIDRKNTLDERKLPRENYSTLDLLIHSKSRRPPDVQSFTNRIFEELQQQTNDEIIIERIDFN